MQKFWQSLAPSAILAISVIWPSVSERLLAFFVLTLIRPLGALGLLVRLEDTFFAASDAAMRVQPFKHELSRRNQNFRPLFSFDAHRRQLLRESLDILDAIEDFLRAGSIGQLNLATDFEPLHHLLHVHIFEEPVVSFGNGGADQFARDGV